MIYKDFIVSMATIPERISILKTNIKSILTQEDVLFDKFLIVVNKYESEDVLQLYSDIQALDKRINVVLGDNKWKSCNKLIYPLQHYHDKTLIVVDDDINYYSHAFHDMLEMHERYPECIIAHETNPVRITDTGFIEYFNTWQTKFKQKCFDKYLSCSCLFPIGTFDNTEVQNYDKMIELTNGMHDELWFWVNSSLNGVKSICLNHTLTFVLDDVITKAENALGDVNGEANKIIEYNLKVNALYSEQLRKVFKENSIDFVVTEDTYYGIIGMMQYLLAMYKNYRKMTFDVSKLAKSYRTMFTNNMSKLMNFCEIIYE